MSKNLQPEKVPSSQGYPTGAIGNLLLYNGILKRARSLRGGDFTNVDVDTEALWNELEEIKKTELTKSPKEEFADEKQRNAGIYAFPNDHYDLWFPDGFAFSRIYGDIIPLRETIRKTAADIIAKEPYGVKIISLATGLALWERLLLHELRQHSSFFSLTALALKSDLDTHHYHYPLSVLELNPYGGDTYYPLTTYDGSRKTMERHRAVDGKKTMLMLIFLGKDCPGIEGVDDDDDDGATDSVRPCWISLDVLTPDYIFYIGELTNYSPSEAFYSRLKREYDLAGQYPIPQWGSFNNICVLYEKKKKK